MVSPQTLNAKGKQTSFQGKAQNTAALLLRRIEAQTEMEPANHIRKAPYETRQLRDQPWSHLPMDLRRKTRLEIDWLARGGRKRKKRSSCRNKSPQIQGRIPICNRDQEASDRADFGHLEVDTIVSRESPYCICASIDSKTRFLRLSKMKRCGADEMSRVLIKSWSPLQDSNLLKTITYDNGKENTKHRQTKEILATRSFLARPYKSCDKGSIEQCIRLVRRFLPKKIDFALISQNKLNTICHIFNSRPRKCLGFRSPLEALAVHFRVALTHWM